MSVDAPETVDLHGRSSEVQVGNDCAARLQVLRREFHSLAEPGWCEFQTTAKIVQGLTAVGLEVRYGRAAVRDLARMGLPPADDIATWWARARTAGVNEELLEQMKGGLTGAVGVLRGDQPGPITALRFDIDANLGPEASDDGHKPARDGFASRHRETHHNCGHDAHAALGLALAEVLAPMADRLRGEVRFLFQPAEEGLRGAQAMVDAGALDDVNALFGCHIGVQAARTGMIICGYENILASIKLDAQFEGEASHAALSPQRGRNALLAACTATQGLYALPQHGDGETRVNVGLLQAGSSRNTVPANAYLAAELRASTSEILEHLEQRSREVLEGAAAMYGTALEIRRMGASGPGDSCPQAIDVVRRAAAIAVGVNELQHVSDFRACDDVAVMMRIVQARGGIAGYFGLGTTMDGPHHNPRFDLDEDSLVVGLSVFLNILIELGNIPRAQ